MKITIAITADVEPDRLPKLNDPDEEAFPRFLRWLVARRTEGPVIEVKVTSKYGFHVYPEPAGRQLPILDFVARAVEADEIPDDETEEEEELEQTEV